MTSKKQTEKPPSKPKARKSKNLSSPNNSVDKLRRTSSDSKVQKLSQQISKTKAAQKLKGNISNNKENNKEAVKRRKIPTRIMIVGGKTFKISTKILREIKKCQLSTQNLIAKLPFSRIVREIVDELTSPEVMRIQGVALEALQESAEAYMVQFFEDSYSCTLHARRNTLVVRDMALLQHLRGTQL